MSVTDRPPLLYVAHDARDAEAAQTALGAGGWPATAAISAAHASRLLARGDAFEVVALDPRLPGAVELVAKLADEHARLALYLGADAATAARTGRDRGLLGCGPVSKLASLAPVLRDGPRAHVVTFTTVLRAAWLARATVAVRVGVEDKEGVARQVVFWLDRGEPVDAEFGEARGVDAVARLVPGSALSGSVSDITTLSVVVEYETRPAGRTIRCGMPTLLELFDDDTPFVEVLEEEIDLELWTDKAWASQDAPDDPEAHELVARAASLDGVLEAFLVDATGNVIASVGNNGEGRAEAVELWSALALGAAAATPDDMIEEVVVAGEDVLDVLRPLYAEARVLHVRFARTQTNRALASSGVLRICRGNASVPPQRASSASSREITP